jgi:NDP-sugar pyrophosphorylase family protein
MIERADLASTNTLILCGGLGTRLATRLDGLPKFLAPIGDRPYAEHLLNWLSAWDLREVVLCVGHLAEPIRAFCGDGARWGISLRYSQEETPLGTAGALERAIRERTPRTLLVLNGDTLLGFDPHAALRIHAAGGTPATVLVAAVADRSRFGAIDVDAISQITQFAEKGRRGPGLVNAGVYVLNTDVLRSLPPRRPLSLEIDVLPHLPRGALRALVVPGPFLDFGTIEAFDGVADPSPFLPRPATS